MNIYAKAGSKVAFANQTAGYIGDQEYAAKHLVVGGIYTVSWTEVGGSRTEVYLEEKPGCSFNSVMFNDHPQSS